MVGIVEAELRPPGGDSAVEGGAAEPERQRDVTVPDEHEPLCRVRERRERDLRRQDVLPDGIARAAVEEAELPVGGMGFERLEERARAVFQVLLRPAGACGRVGRELLDVEPAEHREIVVSDQRERRVLGHERAARIRVGPVTYEVAEAPDLVDRVLLDRSEDRLERMHVPVNVRDDRDAHRKRTLAQGLGVLAFAGAWGAAAVLLLRTRVPADLVLPELEAAGEFDAATLARIDEFRSVTRTLWALSVALELLVLIVLVRRARRLAGGLTRLARGRVRAAVCLGLAAVLLVWLAQLPLGAAGHWWRRRYGLSQQGYAGWAKDAALSLGVRAVLVSLAVAGAVALAVRFGRRWPLAGAPALVAVGAAFLVAQPLLVQPLFNRFEPLPDRSLANEVQRLAAEMGVDVTTVQVADASRRTTTANAYVAGLGPTRRVVFYDTALDGRFDEAELAALAAHELAHVERRHLWKGLAWFVLLAVPGLVLLGVVTERRGGLRDPALVPLGLLLAVALTLATLPVQNALSRRYEAEADWIALVATKDPASVAALERRFAVTSLADPDPPGWARVLLSTHPPTLDRIAMARAFAARTDGSTMAP